MLNLQQLAHDEEELEAEQAAAQGQKGIASAEDDGDEDGGGMFFDNDTPEPPATSAMVPFPAAIATPAPSPERPAETKPPREQQPQNEQSEHEPPAQAAAQPKHEQKNTQYEGFTSDYAEYASYYATDPYGVGYGGYAAPQGGGPAKKNVFCCLFAPWNAEKVDSSEEEGGPEQAEEKAPVAAVAPESVPKEVAYSAEEEEEKKAEDNSAGVVIEPPQGPTGGENEKEAVAPAVVTAGAEEAKEEEQAAGDKATAVAPAPAQTDPAVAAEEQKTAEKPPPKGILKKRISTMHRSPSADASKRGGGGDDASISSDHRRHMFPTYSSTRDVTTSNEPSKNKNKLAFASMARVVTVSSRKEMAFVQKSQIWWQRTDFDDFKKTGRIIAKAMLEGGSQIWLTSNDAWGKKKSQAAQGSSRRASVESGGGGSNNNTNEDEADTKYERALHKYSRGLTQDAGEAAHEAESMVGNKWWCKFGHSRRGLEHIASMEEGRQRQRNVNTASRAVMDEQRRQRMNRTKDAEKLALIAHQYTSWARDLALAAGAADAEAVRVNFKSDARCRTHYLVTGVKGAPNSTAGASASSMSGAVTSFTDSKKYGFIAGHMAAELLDANTSSSFKTKREDAKQARALTKQNSKPLVEVQEAIHDPDVGCDKMAKKAAGFAANEDEKVDMSAVLTGMGSVTVQG